MEFSFGKSDIAAFERLLRAYDEAMGRDAELNNSNGVSLSEAELRKLGAKKLDPRVYEKDPYYQALSGLAKRKAKGATLGKTTIKARSPFLANEERSKEGDAASIVQPYGYFDRDFAYPSISEDGRIWMSLCPHEIETMREAAQKLTGRILVLGLGLGYVPYLLSLKTEIPLSFFDLAQPVLHDFPGLFPGNIFQLFLDQRVSQNSGFLRSIILKIFL